MVSLNRDEILNTIPHRDPFVWIDEVVELSETQIKARKFLDPDLEVFAGHYPRFPVLPGVLQCEAAFQAGAVLITKCQPLTEGHVPVVTRLNNVKFRRMIRPGETMDLDVELNERHLNAFFLSGKVSVDGEVATRLDFACATAEVEL